MLLKVSSNITVVPAPQALLDIYPYLENGHRKISRIMTPKIVFGTHSMDTDFIFENEPGGHNEQAPLPVVALYSPMRHSLQAPPSSPVKPGLHLQSVILVLATAELESSGQHTTKLPETGLYVPVLHASQGPPSTPVCGYL